MKRKRVNIITMGCSKNLVDSERLQFQLVKLGYELVEEDEPSEIIVVNTCGFIADAKEESIQMILRLAEQKRYGKLESLYVMGCLSERYAKELKEEIPQIDACFGKFDWTGLVRELGGDYDKQHGDDRILTTPSYYAYVKVSEGCDRHCAYCAIPLMTGSHVSRPMENILKEVRQLVKAGVKEIQLIAQEITFYGIDLYHRQAIAELVRRMAQIEGVEWIRLHYAYPTDFPLDLLDVIRDTPNVCKYLDIAFQHISTNVLKRMLRHTTKEETLSLIETIRERVPGICLRTTLLVGFPQETEEEFEELKDFVRSARFEHLGAFTYSEEEGTFAAAHYKNDVPEDVKLRRLDEIMEIQQGISEEICATRVGSDYKVIIDRIENNYYIGRTEYDSPEVDGEVLISCEGVDLNIGDFYYVHITSADEFDLYGEVKQ